MYDLLLKGGTVVDPSRNLHEKLDVGITGDRVTGLAASIGVSEATHVIDVSLKLVAPGLVVSHVWNRRDRGDGAWFGHPGS